MSMKRQVTPAMALDRLKALCSRSEQSVCDVRRKLAAWSIAPGDADRIVSALARCRYVDDCRFARAYVRDKYRFSRWGRQKIKLGLVQKRISSGLIAEAMEEIDEDGYRANLLYVLRAKARSLGDEAATYDGRTRIFRHGMARGYEPALVIDVIKSGELWEGC